MARVSSVRAVVMVGGLIAVSSAALGAILDSSLSTLDRPPATALPPSAGQAPGPPSIVVPNPPGTGPAAGHRQAAPAGPQPSDAGPPPALSQLLPVRTGSVSTTPVPTVALPLPVSLAPMTPADEVERARGLSPGLESAAPKGTKTATPTSSSPAKAHDKSNHAKTSLGDATVQPYAVTTRGSHGPAKKPADKAEGKATPKPAKKAHAPAPKPSKQAREETGERPGKPATKARHQPHKAASTPAPHQTGKAKGHPASRHGRVRFR